jgi:hypothetical protein
MVYFLAHNKIDVFHYGELLEGQVIETGQPNLEYFNTLQELKDKLVTFGVEYQEPSTGSSLPEPDEPETI